MSVLQKIKSPQDIKGLSKEELLVLCGELRSQILATVSKTGGHLSSNLGAVEVTVALHKVFNTPSDRVIFDVSHQSYAHKILTGRGDRFDTLRQAGGVSGFSNPAESVYDPVYAGHSGSSLSEALAFAVADKQAGSRAYTVAVVGDGAFTNGMIYEALNNCADSALNLIIVLNDNEMSISENIGGLNKALRRLRSSAGYFRFKHGLQRVLRHIPILGKGSIWLGRKIKNFVKNLFLQKNIFENLGLDYIGPVDGNNLKRTCSALAEAKRRGKCCVVHVHTKKGLGYPPAEAQPAKYHAVPPFDLKKGLEDGGGESFSSRFGQYVSDLASKDNKICAITAAMGYGTGLDLFAAEHPSRFFDVGIAEEHAVTFGAGLAAAGELPVCAIYSTFAQRVFDQLFQDVCLAGHRFVLALDRCGFVEGDGVTHQGIYDVALFKNLPGVGIYSPATFCELEYSLNRAFAGSGLGIVRYPKGGEISSRLQYVCGGDMAVTQGVQNCQTVVVCYGRIEANIPQMEGVGIIRLIKIFPPDYAAINELLASAKNVYVLEEGVYGGLACELCAHFSAAGKRVVSRTANGVVKHGCLRDMYGANGFLPEQIKEDIIKSFGLK